MTTPDIAGVMQAAMGEEDRRRELASHTPGAGAPLPLPQPPADAGQGSPPVVGEGYSVTAAPAPLQVVSDHGPLVYGQQAPQYADDAVGGVGFQAGREEPPIRVLIGTRSADTDGAVFLSPSSPRRGRLARLLRRRK